MTLVHRHRRLLAAPALMVAVAGVAVGWASAPATAEPLGPGWEGSFVEPFGDGVTAGGEQLEVPVVFEFTGPPGSRITELDLSLLPQSAGCDSISYRQVLDDGTGSSTPPTTTPDGTITVDWTFRVDPGCNGVYDVSVTATATLPPVVNSRPTTNTSSPLVARGVSLSLTGPGPTAVTAQRGADGSVTVAWQPPPTWVEDGPPRDAVGFLVQRTGSDGAPITIADDVGVDQRSIVDTAAASLVSDHYRYLVVAVRHDASGATTRSRAGEAAIDIGVPPTTAPPATTAPPPSSFGTVLGGARVGAPVVQAPPTTAFDPGYQDTLDYQVDQLGDDEQAAVPPADAGFFDVDEAPVGAGVATPAAVGLCLAVWAAHLRHLARRAAPPLH